MSFIHSHVPCGWTWVVIVFVQTTGSLYSCKLIGACDIASRIDVTDEPRDVQLVLVVVWFNWRPLELM